MLKIAWRLIVGHDGVCLWTSECCGSIGKTYCSADVLYIEEAGGSSDVEVRNRMTRQPKRQLMTLNLLVRPIACNGVYSVPRFSVGKGSMM